MLSIRPQTVSTRLTKVSLGLLPLLLAFCLPATAQLPGEQPDPLARIREAAKTNVQACSATGETLCEQVAPKIIANAQGDSPLPENLRHLAEAVDGGKAGTPAETRAVAWAVAAFRDAGVEVHTEKSGMSATSSEEASRQQENVIAEIRGREKPDEWVLVGAHLDSPGPAPGSLPDSLDEECNAALLVEAARDIQLTGIRPRRSIRFVLFGGDDRGMTGSRAYVTAHGDELDRARGVILFAAGASHVDGFVLNGRHDIESAIREAMKPIDSLGAGDLVFDAPLEADSLDFLLEGIPTIIATAHAASGLDGPRSASNSLDKINVQELKRNTAITAVIAFDIAERAEPLGPRQSRTEVESLLETTGLAGRMKTSDLWQPWESGQRGRLP